MPREIFLKIDDDLARTTAKIKRVDGSDLTLAFPKGSMMLSSAANLKALKRNAEALGKNISILTNDSNGQNRAMEAGIPLASFGKPGIAKAAQVSVPVSKPIAVKTEPKPIPRYEPKPEPVAEPEFFTPEPPPSVITPEPLIFPKQRRAGATSHFRHTRNSTATAWIAVTLLSLILIGLVLLVFLPHGSVTVYAHTQPITRELNISLDKSVTSADTKNLIMPAQVLDKDQQQSKTYQTTGKQNVGTIARGTVQIYNYTGKTLKLNAATTTLTVGQNVYHPQSDISGIKPTVNVPGTNAPDPKTLISVAVFADQPGDSYNVPAGTRFEIHNKVLGDAPTLYAINAQEIDSGASKFTAIVSSQDLDNAGADIKNTVVDSAKQQLLNKSGMLLVNSGAQYMLGDPAFSAKPGDQTVSFNAQVGGHIKALVFEKNLLQNIVTQRINLTLDKDQKLDDSQAQWDYKFTALDLDKGTGTLNVKYTGVIVSTIDPKQIQGLASGKSPAALKDLLTADSRIDGADISVRPFWAKTLPSLESRIDVQVKVK